MFRPASLLFVLLILLISFVCGAVIAGLSGAAEGQGLAGGAIILFYGFMGSIVGLIGGVILVRNTQKATIIKFNKVLMIVAIMIIAWIVYRVQTS